MKRAAGHPWMLATAVFAIVWAIARAAVQSITIDEADTYLAFVSRPQPFQWYPASNNHVLNSLLMRLFTSVFGVYPLTVRAPALIGAAIYIAAVYAFCRLLRAGALLEWVLFVCLVFNPFVFDYLVAARGYGMALGFLLWAVVIPAASLFEDHSIEKACAWMSVCVALSFAANFSFAYVDAAIFLAMTAWASRRKPILFLLPACVLPGLVISFFLTFSIVFSMPKAQLWYGSHSLAEMFRSVIQPSFYRLNPNLLSPLAYPVIASLQRFLLPALAIFSVILAAIAWVRRRALDAINRRRFLLSGVLLAAPASALCVHWLVFHFFDVPLPEDRTGLFLAALPIAAAGALAAIKIPSAKWIRRVQTVTLLLFAVYFLGCLRLNYFEQWIWDADTRQIYSVLAYYNHTYEVKDVACNWRFTSALNFYRVASGHETLSEFVITPTYPLDRSVYVLPGEEQGFADQQHLKVVYRGAISQAIVAIRPEIEKAAVTRYLQSPLPAPVLARRACLRRARKPPAPGEASAPLS